MKYAVIEITGAGRGYTIRRAILARRNRVFLGSYHDCAAWIAGFKAALASRQSIPATPKLVLVSSPNIEAAS